MTYNVFGGTFTLLNQSITPSLKISLLSVYVPHIHFTVNAVTHRTASRIVSHFTTCSSIFVFNKFFIRFNAVNYLITELC